jgi:Fe(3+) dicitrate transport protein
MSIVNSTYLVDPNLKDETGYSADMGIRGHISDILNYDVSIFTIHYNDKIGMIPSLVVADKEYVTNISQSRNFGFESFAEVDIWKLIKGSEAKMKVAVFSNLSFTDARYVHSQNSSVEGNYVESVPPIILKTGVTFQKNRFTATYQYSYMAKQFGDATNATTPSDNGIYGLVPSYYVMDLTADYKLSKRFMFSGSINNLTNHMYFTRRADSYPGPGIIPADARSFYLTLQAKL